MHPNISLLSHSGMLHLVQAIVACAFLSLTMALSLPPAIAITQNTTILNSSSTNLTWPGLPRCDPRDYGHGLNPESCENAC